MVMNELQQRIFAVEAEDAPALATQADRRREPRVRVTRPVYVQPADPANSDFEEVRTMKDFSRSGIYFTTERDFYSQGMQLYVVPAVGCFNFEYVGEVVRVDRLADNEYGIAVRVLRIRSLPADSRTATMSAFRSFALADRTPLPRKGLNGLPRRAECA
jgi:hypothetical protein